MKLLKECWISPSLLHLPLFDLAALLGFIELSNEVGD